MIPVPPVQWLRAPANRVIIERWTRNAATGHRIELPPGFAGDDCTFLALGDTGDSEVTGSRKSPQTAIAETMALRSGLLASGDAGPAGAGSPPHFILHTGDVVYMSGERRLYDRNFRRPYQAFLTAGSTYSDLVFRIPFFPVPGNHDYYDFLGFAAALVRIPLLGAGLRTIARELFDFSLPQGGSEMGRAFMDAFVARDGDGGAYVPGERTRIPNRYYWFRTGPVDVFALDSNTLDAPAPPAGVREARAEAQRESREWKARLSDLEGRLLAVQRQIERSRSDLRRAFPAERRRATVAATGEVTRAAQQLARTLGEGAAREWNGARAAASRARAAWGRGLRRLRREREGEEFARALARLDREEDALRQALAETDRRLLRLPAGTDREAVLERRDELDRSFRRWCEAGAFEAGAGLGEEAMRIRDEILAAQRGIARETLRARFSPADHDSAQLRWLDAELSRSVRERPRAWRIVVLHHPPWTTGTSYSENDELRSVRENLIEALGGRVHLLLAGHSHAFEWIRTTLLPQTAVIVSGGGGQVNLARSVLDPERTPRHRNAYRGLLAAGLVEAAFAARGPTAPDGTAGPLHHYLEVNATPETLRIRPIGVRRLREGESYRVEIPMPVHHATEVRPEGCAWSGRLLRHIELRPEAPPEAVWA